jgi:hypothetical protein
VRDAERRGEQAADEEMRMNDGDALAAERSDQHRCVAEVPGRRSPDSHGPDTKSRQFRRHLTQQVRRCGQVWLEASCGQMREERENVLLDTATDRATEIVKYARSRAAL